MDRVQLSESEAATSLLQEGDLVFARQSLVLSGAGKCSIFLGDDEPVCFESHIIRVRIDHKKANPTYLYYFFQSPRGRAAVESIVEQGAGASGIRGSDLARLEFHIPDLGIQNSIASILSLLDDKIDLNQRMNNTLEAIARAIFRDWFVDFGPTRAKAEGRNPYLASDVWSLFPDRFDNEEKPEGWPSSNVGNHFKLTMGQSPPGSTYNEVGDGLPFFQGRTDFGFRFPTRRVFCTAPTRLAEAGDTLVSVRAPVGDVNIAIEPCAIGRGVAAIRHISGSRSFTYHALHNLGEHFARFEGEGTVFGSINRADFESLPFIAPPQKVLDCFETLVSACDDRVEFNEKESLNLGATRDLLLAKLMSGKVHLREAERLIERVS